MIWFWLNMPLAAAFFAAWVAIPLWLVFKHSDDAAEPVTVQTPAAACPVWPVEQPVVVAPQVATELAAV